MKSVNVIDRKLLCRGGLRGCLHVVDILSRHKGSEHVAQIPMHCISYYYKHSWQNDFSSKTSRTRWETGKIWKVKKVPFLTFSPVNRNFRSKKVLFLFFSLFWQKQSCSIFFYLFIFNLFITTILLIKCLFLYYQPRTDKTNTSHPQCYWHSLGLTVYLKHNAEFLLLIWINIHPILK